MAETVSEKEERDRREGRGRLSSIHLLPEECDDDVAWANMELRERKMPQTEILRQFNARIADKGQSPISKGAFSRYSVRLSIEVRKLDASRQITDAILTRIAPGERSEGMIAATELLKYRILEMVMDADGEPNPKLLGEATLALQRLSATAAREADVQRRDRKEQREEEARAAETAARAQAEQEAAAAATTIASEAGLGADKIAAIRRGVLGLAA
jgi:hypothetical protein